MMSQLAEDDLVSITIKDWIRSATELYSRKGYIQNAVNLALLLTTRLNQLMACSGVAQLSLSDISAENISILTRQGAVLSIKDVRLELDAPLCILAKNIAPPLSSGAVCNALGNILLELFSKGKSNTNKSLSSSFKRRKANLGNSGKTPPSSRSTTNSTTATAAARKLLLDLRMPVHLCNLICDLLDADASMIEPSCQSSESASTTAITSLDEALTDLTGMKTDPQEFLFGLKSPQEALSYASFYQSTDNALFLESEKPLMCALARAKKNISDHVNDRSTSTSSGQQEQEHIFLCETVCISGSSSSWNNGKPRLLHSFIKSCNEEEWFVVDVDCKSVKQDEPHVAIANGLNTFFSQWGHTDKNDNDHVHNSNHNHNHHNQSMMKSFPDIGAAIFAKVDTQGFSDLCKLVPVLSSVFPQIATGPGQVGTMTTERHMQLLQILFKSICSAGRPVLLTLQDLHCLSGGSSFAIDTITGFVANANSASKSSLKRPCKRGGLLIAGTLDPSSDQYVYIMGKMELIKQGQGQNSNLAKLSIGAEIAGKEDLSMMLSLKLCLPIRYTRELACIIHRKTKGDHFHVVQFIKTILQGGLLSFSAESCQWTWDKESIEKQDISVEVAELIIESLGQLPWLLMKTLQIVACLGSQVEETTINVLNLGHDILPFDMQEKLCLAVNDGIMDKVAGPMYKFAHLSIQQAIYERIPAKNRKLFAKTIGKSLLKNAPGDPTIHLLAVDQLNLYCLGNDDINSKECALYVGINIQASKHAIAASKFEQGQNYINTGMQLLQKSGHVQECAPHSELDGLSNSNGCLDSKKSGAEIPSTSIMNTMHASCPTFGTTNQVLNSCLDSEKIGADKPSASIMDAMHDSCPTLGETDNVLNRCLDSEKSGPEKPSASIMDAMHASCSTLGATNCVLNSCLDSEKSGPDNPSASTMHASCPTLGATTYASNSCLYCTQVPGGAYILKFHLERPHATQDGTSAETIRIASAAMAAANP